MRCSALVQDGGTNILLDCGPDFREQMLRAGFGGPLHALFITHEHYDHVGGIDDLRPLSYGHDVPVYADAGTCRHLRESLHYCFAEPKYPGVPRLLLREVSPGEAVGVGGLTVMPLAVMHGRLPILGYRIGPVGYVTDMTGMPQQSRELLRGIRLLVINGLRHEPHSTHQTVEEAIAFSRSLAPDLPTYIIHMSHHLGLHAEEDAMLPPGVRLAYDGMVLEV